MHTLQKNFSESVKSYFPIYFNKIKVLDCGSLDINGNNRYLFQDCDYLGIDIGTGKNVDIVSTIHEFDYPDNFFDTIISTECFEHDMYYDKSLINICRLLKKNGLLLFTCATVGRREHGTTKMGAKFSPLTSSISIWSDYYKNLEEKDIREVIDIDQMFSQYEFKVDKIACDLYFWGIKK